METTGQQLLQHLLGEWGLLRELGILQGLFLSARPWLDVFAAGLFARLAGGRSLADVPSYELTALAHNSLLAACQPGEACPNPEAVSGGPALAHEMQTLTVSGDTKNGQACASKIMFSKIMFTSSSMLLEGFW